MNKDVERETDCGVDFHTVAANFVLVVETTY